MPKASPSARTAALTLTRNRTYQFQVRAVDVAGNVGAWKPAGAFRLAVAQEATRALSFVRGTWSRTTSVSYDGGAARSTRTVGGIARFTFTGNSFAWVAAKSPVRGVAHVYVDGTFAGNVHTDPLGIGGGAGRCRRQRLKNGSGADQGAAMTRPGARSTTGPTRSPATTNRRRWMRCLGLSYSAEVRGLPIAVGHSCAGRASFVDTIHRHDGMRRLRIVGDRH